MSPKDMSMNVDRFLAEVAAMLTLRGRMHSLGEDLGAASLREFLEACVSNSVEIHVVADIKGLARIGEN